MNEASIIKDFFSGSGTLFLYGLISATIYLSSISLDHLRLWIWGWIHDEKRKKYSLPVLVPYLLAGYKLTDPYDINHGLKRKNGDSEDYGDRVWTVICILFAMIVTPFLVVKFWPVIIIGATIVSLMHIARFTVRLRKKLNEHMADPKAHSKSTK